MPDTPTTPAAPSVDVAAAPVTTPVAPIVEQVVPVTQPTPVKTEPVKDPRLLSKKEARELGASRAKEAYERLTGKHDEPAVVGVIAPTPTPESTPATPPVDGAIPTPDKPLTGIKIEIDQKHPALGGRKVEAITVSTPQEEQLVRALLNGSYFRRQDVEKRDATITRLETELRDNRQKLLEKNANESARHEWEGTPEYNKAVEAYHKILETQGEHAAKIFWRGVNIEFKAQAEAKYKVSLSEVETQDATRAAEAWGEEAYESSLSWLPDQIAALPDFQRWFREAYAAFDAEIGLGHFPQVTDSESMHKAFVQFFQTRLINQPSVRDTYNRLRNAEQQQTTAASSAAVEEQKKIDAIKKQAVEDYQKSLAASRNAAPPNPLGAIVAASRNRAPDSAEPESVQAPTSSQDNRRQAREGARNLAKQRMERLGR